MTEPAADILGMVAARWSEVFGVENLEENADFFELGGDSLAALEIASALLEALGRPDGIEEDLLALATLEHPTLGDFARYLEDELKG